MMVLCTEEACAGAVALYSSRYTGVDVPAERTVRMPAAFRGPGSCSGVTVGVGVGVDVLEDEGVCDGVGVPVAEGTRDPPGDAVYVTGVPEGLADVTTANLSGTVCTLSDVSVADASITPAAFIACITAPAIRLAMLTRLKMTTDVMLYAPPRSTIQYASPNVELCSECVMSMKLSSSAT